MVINLNETPDYALTWLLEFAEEAAQQEKEDLKKV
jgi:hypothetical protein